MEPPSLKLRSSMKGRTKKIVLAFHGAPKQVVRGIHKRPNAFLLWPIHKKSKKVEHKKNCAWPLLELSNSKFESSTKSWTQNFFVFSPFGASELQVQKLHKELSIKKLHLGPLQAFELWAQKLPHLPSAISLHLVSNFWHQKLEAKYNFFCVGPSLNFQAQSLEAPRGADANLFMLNLQLLAPRVGDQVQKFLFQPHLQLSSLELESFKRGSCKFTCLGWAPKNPKKIHYFKTL